MGFMEKQVTDKRKWLEIDGTSGIEAVDASDARDVVTALHNGDDDEHVNELALEYYSGSQVFSVEIREGYGARLSAPGYMDCTDWSVFDTAEEAEQYLADTYDDDDADELNDIIAGDLIDSDYCKERGFHGVNVADDGTCNACGSEVE